MPYKNSHIKGWVRVLFVIIAYLFVGNVFKLIGVVVAGIDMYTQFNQATILQLLTVTFFDFIGIVGVLFLFLKIIDKESFIGIGLCLRNRSVDILIGILIGFFTMGLGILALISIDAISYKGVNLDLYELCYMFFLYIIVALKEELLYRAYILRNLMYSFKKYKALLISAVLFALMHSMNTNLSVLTFINIFLGGIMLGLPYMLNKNLWFPITLHFSWNFFQSLFGVNAGDAPYSLFVFQKSGSGMINIGESYFEQPILFTLMYMVLIIAIYIWYLKKKTSSHATE